MLSFKSFLNESKEFFTEVALNSSGRSADRHTNKYITPYLPGGEKAGKGTHTVASGIGHLQAGDKVTLHSHSVEDGVHHVSVSKIGSAKKVSVPTSKLHKPVIAKNIGFEKESALASRLSKHGLMSGSGAGFTAGNDFHLIDKRGSKEKKIKGTEGFPAKEIQGEHKSDIKSTAFGQITLSRHPKTGKWHISDEARAKRPGYADHVEKATVTVGGRKRSLLDHLNKTEPAGTRNKTGFESDETTTAPAHAYLKDHHVDVLHVDSHGTYRAGMSQHRDKHSLGLPSLNGAGKFRVRQKTDDTEKRTVQFSIKRLDKSHVNLAHDDHLKALKAKLGHQ